MGMSAIRTRIFGTFSAIAFLLIVLPKLAPAAGIKLKVTIDNSAVYMSPGLGSQKVANMPLNKILDSEGRQGDFYKVTWDQNGVRIPGYIHKEDVEEVSEREAEQIAKQAGLPGVMVKSQTEIAVQLDSRIEENKILIRQAKDLDKAVENLRPLIARVFGLEDLQNQKRVACNVYYWLGVALAKQGDSYSAIREFRNMFEVDAGFAAEAAKNDYDPVVSRLIDNAEKQFKGLLVDYTLNINTEPKEATIKIDGKVIGNSPLVHQTANPKFTLEIDKEGYAPVKEILFLTEPVTQKSYPLQSLGRTIKVASTPPAARVFLDDRDTGKVTECELPYVAYGEHKVRIAMENYADWEESIQLLEGPSPYPVSAVLAIKNYAPSRKWGGLESKFLKLPKAVAIDKSGNIYIADESDYKVRKYDSELRTLNWSDPDHAIRNLDAPAGIAFDSQGFMYVTDSGNSCVVKFDRNGKQLGKWGRQGVRNIEFNGPTGIAVDKNNDFYVADTGNHRVVKYAAGGGVKKVWGRQGTTKGDFMSPTGIAVNAQNEIIVVDKWGRIQKFTTEGVPVAEFAKLGSGEGELSRPLGLCLDAEGNIYVADTGNNRIEKFTPGGKVITLWGGGPGPAAQMTGPAGVAVNDKGAVFVVEKDVNRIQEFRVPTK
jgi:DNA-binding beta-propeller fold protein YncE